MNQQVEIEVVVSLLLERQAELSALHEAIQSSWRGAGEVVLIQGPAGIGKTTLLDQAAQLGTAAGFRVLTARGTELERDFGFGVIRQLFEPVLAQATAHQRAALLGGSAGAAATVLGQVDGDDIPVGDFSFLHGLYWLTANLCREMPLLLIIDDLHWADKASLRFLVHLQPRLDGLETAVVCATRPHELGAEQELIDAIALDPFSRVLQPSPLSEAGGAAVLAAAGTDLPAPDFIAACHKATGGNPLLLKDLARAVADEGLAPTTGNAGRVHALSGWALATRVRSRLAQLPDDCVVLAKTVAILGGDTPLSRAAALAGLDRQAAAVAADQLVRLDLFWQRSPNYEQKQGPTPTGPHIGFVHPLVRSAIYEQLDLELRISGHAAAANYLIEAEADPEQVASHLLRIPASGDDRYFAILRSAADQATRRGAPEAAVSYLERCLHESDDEADTLTVLEALGTVAMSTNIRIAPRYLERAYAMTDDPNHRARIAERLGYLYVRLQRSDDAVSICTDALAELDESQESIRRRLYGLLLAVGLIEPARSDLRAKVARFGALPFHDSLGGRELAGLLAGYETYRSAPSALDHARQALSGDMLIETTLEGSPLLRAWLALLAADDPEAMASMDVALANAYQRGSLADLTTVLAFRPLGWLRRGALAEGAADAREGVRAIEMSGMVIARPFLGPFFAEILVEQGKYPEAVTMLDWIGPTNPLPRNGPLHLYLYALACLQRAEGNHSDALDTALAAGKWFATLGGDNPAVVPWRTEAALSLHALDRTAEARDYATQEIELARRWGAPYSLGRALRVAGLVAPKQEGVPLLQEAVTILGASPARLEHAKALIDLGSLLRRTGQRVEARQYLALGLDLAGRCGSPPLSRLAIAELHQSGARPRRTNVAGPASLTPSELRVADLAAKQVSNREIAQLLFVTTKTVEVHLSNVYRKLDIRTRAELPRALASESTDSQVR